MGKSDLHDHDRGWTPLPDGYSRIGAYYNHPRERRVQPVRTMFIYEKELMYDIEAQASMAAGARKTDTGNEDNAATDNTERYEAQFRRWIWKHVETVKEALIRDIVRRENTAAGDEQRDVTEEEIVLAMPDWWDGAAWQPLVMAVHDYIVNAVLSEYYKVIYTSKDPLTVDKTDEATLMLGKIRAYSAQHKAGTIRRYLNPMGF